MPTIWLWAAAAAGATAAVKQAGRRSFASKHNGRTCTQCCTTVRVVIKSKKGLSVASSACFQDFQTFTISICTFTRVKKCYQMILFFKFSNSVIEIAFKEYL